MRRPFTAVLLSVGIFGCHREGSFDDRYEKTARNIEQRAATLDNELDQAANAPTPQNRPAPH